MAAPLQISNGKKPNVVMNGRRVLQLSMNKVVVKDLRLYVSGSLAALPAMFSFEDELEKGFFPHLLSGAVDVHTFQSDSWPPVQ